MKCAERIDNRSCFVHGVSGSHSSKCDNSSFLPTAAFQQAAVFAFRVLVFKAVAKSVRVQQKFTAKNVVSSPKFVAFFVIRWYTIFAV